VLELYRRGAGAEEIRRAEAESGIETVLEDIGVLVDENLDGLGRIAEIVDDLKNLARTGPGEGFTDSDMGTIVRRALLIARNELKYHADLKLELASVAPVPCNAREVTQVLLNLIVNAAQAIKGQERSDRGLVTVRVSEDAAWVRCAVSDDGPGVADDRHDVIFEPFFTTKPPGEGTGLGLHICRDIVVNRHGGTIEMHTTMGQGTTFVVSLPRDR
jgi:signal transduction histidine kinase